MLNRRTGFLERVIRPATSTVLLLIMILTQFSFLGFIIPRYVEASEVTLTGNANQNAVTHNVSGSKTVFVSDQVGYVFYRSQPSNGPCVYQKTTDGGTTWGGQITIDSSNNCASLAVWYDRWTPNDNGSHIHIVTMEQNISLAHLYYNRLDTSNDTLWLGTNPVNISTSSNQVGTFQRGINVPTITKSTGGSIFAAISDVDDSFVLYCSTSCNQENNWNEAGSSLLGNANDWNLLVPLTDGGVMIINRQIGAPRNIQSAVWNGSSWSGWSTIQSNVITSTTYDVGMSFTIDQVSGDVLLAYAADNNNFTTDNHDVRTARHSGGSSGSWSNTTDVFTNSPGRGLHNVAIAIDNITATVYVGYSIRTSIGTNSSANIFWATSTTAMTSWGIEQGPVSTVSGNIYGFNMNLMSDERIYATWYDATVSRTIRGATIASLTPFARVTAIGNHQAVVRGGEINQYIGGTFVVEELVGSRNVTNVTITELGSIDASEHLSNVRLRYKLDTTAPYDCTSESYDGTETQFGDVLPNGFSGPNGVASFSDSVAISTTSALCLYVIADVANNTPDGVTIDYSIASPVTDVLVSGGVEVIPNVPVAISGSTTVVNDTPNLFGYHWRNDDGNETDASSATGGVANTPIVALQQNTPRRLRLAVDNSGSTSTPTMDLQLEYGVRTTVCEAVAAWTPVNYTNAHFASFDSTFVTDGANTTDIAVGIGGVPNPLGSAFKTPNSGQLDTTATATAVSLLADEFIELEFSLEATANSIEGTTYCFRVSDAGAPLQSYSEYPVLTVSADVTLSEIGTMIATTTVGSIGVYLGGAFVLRENVSTREVEEIVITQTGSVDGSVGLENISLYYDYDTTAPYNCASESYSGSEAQFGSTANNFSGPQGTVTFTDSITISTTSALCLYVVVDVNADANNGETIGLSIAGGASDIVVSSGSVAPSTSVTLNASTTILGAVVEQFGYHWRNNNGNEADATSATGGSENQVKNDYLLDSPIRLRLGISNEGSVATPNRSYQLQYGIQITTCDAIAVWENVENSAAWQPYDSGFLTHGTNTTDIPLGDGGITNPSGSTFVSSNSGVRTTSAESEPIILANGNFIEYEFSIVASTSAAYDTRYCFRLLNNASQELQYNHYPVIETASKRDFKTQRGVINASAATTVLTAGVDYEAPTASSSAFVRITNAHHTGAGQSTGDVNQTNRNLTAVITDVSDITSSFTIARAPSAANDTRVYWELVEFIGPSGTDNEIIVRRQDSIAMNTSNTVVNGPVISSVADDSKVLVYITGITSDSNSRNYYYEQQVTAQWDEVNQRPVFERGSATFSNLVIGYAVVEYTGINWKVQRVEHVYDAAGVAETETIEPVNSLSRTFIHTQKRIAGQANVHNFGHDVWLSSIGAVSFRLEGTATAPEEHVSVAWVVENMQTSQGRMQVQRQSGTITGGTAPVYEYVSISPVEAMNNTSVSIVTSHSGANTAFPRPIVGFTLNSTSTLEIFRSRSGSTLTYRTEVIEWPTQGLALRQHYYRIYVDNDDLTPIDPWPPGAVDLGENMAMTVQDEPIGLSDRIRLRMAVRTDNANWPAGLYQFKLQYGVLSTTCSAVASWTDVGDAGSGAIWRLANITGVSDGQTLSTNPSTPGDLLLSVSNRSGVISATIPTVTNQYTATMGDFVEFDWPLQHNGAVQKTSYCFRMAYSNNDPIDGYLFYPQIRTAGFTPAIEEWRWYNDSNNETPTNPLAASDVAPTEIANQNAIALRVTVGELRNVTGNNVKFSLQYDESPLFTNPLPVTASSSCNEFSRWCYADVLQTDNATITSALLSSSETCVAGVGDGCGTHNTSPSEASIFTHTPGSSREYAFYLESRTARVGAVYYFRLIDTDDGAPVRLADGASHVSLVSESALLSLTVDGLTAGTTTAGVTLTQTSTPTAIQFLDVPLDSVEYAAHRIGVTTNASDGYRVYMRTTGPFVSSHGGELLPVSGTNNSPLSWEVGCSASSTSCVGYHTTDATLSGTSSRFAAFDTYAALSTSSEEIIYSPIPINESHDIIFGLVVRPLQPAGNYETNIVYIATPIY